MYGQKYTANIKTLTAAAVLQEIQCNLVVFIVIVRLLL